ncbi:hypothetical protein ACWGI1_16960 [Streptomyces sp. NPDC054835]
MGMGAIWPRNLLLVTSNWATVLSLGLDGFDEVGDAIGEFARLRAVVSREAEASCRRLC